ncbi:MAG TPA: hypothetical protein PKZ21_03200 [Bacteroidales bacterium]|nr:hypothetical protein [Bacteroidales bacterium]
MPYKKIIFFFILFFFCFGCYIEAQDVSSFDTINDAKILLRKEKSGFIEIHTSGFGLGYRNGKHLTGYKKRMFEVELTGMKHPKEIKIINPILISAKPYFYGKQNSLFIIRGGYGRQRIINSKPYWGGVEIRYFYYGGVSLGLLKPVYLYIAHDTIVGNLHYFTTTIEKYDPDIHSEDVIYGRAPFLKGFGRIQPVPGIYFKTGLNFEYGDSYEILKAIEMGVTGEFFIKKPPLMAYNSNKNYFFSLFLSFHFGTRGNE